MLVPDNIEMPKQKEPSTLAVVISSRNSQSEKEDFIRQLQTTALYPIHIYFAQNAGTSLTSVYNTSLSQLTEDRVLFIHDDVEILTAGWARKIQELFDNNIEYGIIGVAGSKDFDDSGAWWIYKNIYGQVEHLKEVSDANGNKGFITFLTSFSNKLENHIEEVAIIDGVFMAIDRTRMPLKFDENVKGFNFYDIDFSLNNFTHKTCKIGVTTDIRILHKGLGVIKPEWYVNREVILNKYKDYLPIYNLQVNTPVEGKREVPDFAKK